jgi:6-bladed beta-propeller protein
MTIIRTTTIDAASTCGSVHPWRTVARPGPGPGPRPGAVLLLALAIGCGESTPTVQPVSTIRDSAGIRIIENSSLALADSTSWIVDRANVVNIGELDGDDPYVFGRITGVLRQPDGTIVVGDAEAHEVRFFDRNGRFLRSIGRKGSGPGEFIHFSSLVRYPGDTLMVIDYEDGRSNIFDPVGQYVRSYLHKREESLRGTGVFADGTHLAYESLESCRGRDRSEFCVDSARFFRRGIVDSARATYGVFVSRRNHHAHVENNQYISLEDRQPQPYWATHDRRFYYTDSDRMEVRVFGAQGKLERIIRVRYDPPAPTAETFAISPAMNDETQTAAERRRTRLMQDAYASAALPRRVPALDGMLIDRGGNVWLKEFPFVRAKGAFRWFVFDTAGILRHSVRVPTAMLPPHPTFRWKGEIGDDYLLSVRSSEFGVQSVRVYALIKAASGEERK